MPSPHRCVVPRRGLDSTLNDVRTVRPAGPLGGPLAAKGDQMDVFLSQLFNGLSLGSILLLVALGLAFSFGLMNVINMAHGEMIMVGAYCAYIAQHRFVDVFGSGGVEYYFIVALPLAFVVAAVLGMI